MTSDGNAPSADHLWLLDIQRELNNAAEVLEALAPGITLFGSSRATLDDRHYQFAERLGQWLARANLPVVTGGGPGIMEAANR